MPNITPVQLNFAAGELSPELHYRAHNFRGYQAGLQTMSNFVADPRGPARSRDGFRFVGRVVPKVTP